MAHLFKKNKKLHYAHVVFLFCFVLFYFFSLFMEEMNV